MTVRSTEAWLWNASYMRSTALSRTTRKGDVMKKFTARTCALFGCWGCIIRGRTRCHPVREGRSQGLLQSCEGYGEGNRQGPEVDVLAYLKRKIESKNKNEIRK